MASQDMAVHEVHWVFPPLLRAPVQARHQLVQQLRMWGVGEERIEDCVLVAHELVANAVEHAHTPFDLRVRYDGDVVTIGVDDFSPAAPHLRPHDLRAPRGRGLQMVAAIARRWDCVRFEFGKTVWAEIATGG